MPFLANIFTVGEFFVIFGFMNERKNLNLMAGVGGLVISTVLFLSATVFAADIQITGYVQSGVSIALHGKFSNLVFDSLPVTFENNVKRVAMTDPNNDYIDFVDTSNTAGFYVTVSVSNFAYTGESQTQGPISAGNLKFYGGYDGTTHSALRLGYDDPTKNLSILPDSCGGATTGTFNFHADLSDAAKDYGLAGTTSDQIVFGSSASCANLGHVRFDAAELTMPYPSDIGTYTSTIVWTIYDGVP